MVRKNKDAESTIKMVRSTFSERYFLKLMNSDEGCTMSPIAL